MKKTAKWKRILAVVLTALMVLCNQTVLFADTTVQDTEQETEIREEEPQEVEQDSEDTEYQEIEESETVQPEAEEPEAVEPEADPEQDTQEPVTENKTVYYTVKFLDKDGNEITSQRIAEGQSATAPAAPDVDGYRFNGWDKAFDNVTEDLKVQALYVKIGEKVTYTINYQFSNGTAASQPWVAQLEVGTEYTNTIVSPEITGFTPDQPSVEFSGTVEADQTITVTYSGAETTYTVQHMLQNAEDDEYTLDSDSTETKNGTVGLDTAAEAKSYDGFTALPVSQATINADGSTVVNVYYDRNVYRLTWDTDGGSYEQPVDIRYGAKINEPGNPTKLGYTFKGWEGMPENGRMPSQDLVVKAIWKANQTAQYKVIHWQESLQAPGTYEVAQNSGGNAAIETKTGTVGDVISYSPKSYQGFELDSERSSGDVKITSDGTAVKNVYYNRKTYSIHFCVAKSKDWWGRPSNWEEDKSLLITARYGEDVSSQWNDAAHSKYLWATKPRSNTYYTLVSNMPAQDITVYAYNNQTGKKIIYYVEDLDGSRKVYASFDAGSEMHLTDEDKMPIDGFTFKSWHQNSDRNGRDLWLYYTRNSYTITFQNCTGVNDLSVKFEAPLNNLKPADGSVGTPANVESDYTFAGWYTSPSCEDGTEFDWSGTMPSHTITLYAKWQAPIYTVTFETNGGSPIDPISVEKHQALGDIPETVKENDEFLGWYTDPGLNYKFVESLQIVKDITLYAKWKNTSVYNYCIVAVTRDKDGNETEIARGWEGSVVQNGTANVTAPDIEGYYPKETSKSVIVTKDGQEIKFVYEPVAAWTYTIRYVDTDGNDIADSETVSTRNTVETVVYKAIAGYQLISDPVVQAEKGKTDTIIFKYTTNQAVYRIEHYKQRPDGSYALEETENKEAAAIGTWVTAEPKDYTGYTCITDTDERSGAVKEGLVLKVYYNRPDFTVGNYTGKYDGEWHTAEFAGTGIEGDTYYYQTEDGTWTPFNDVSELPQYKDADSYQISVKVVNDGAESAPKTATVSILPREITLTSGSAQKVYDKEPLTNNEVTVTGDGFVDGEGAAYDVTGSQTEVGSSENEFTYELTEGTKAANYIIIPVFGTLTVSDKDVQGVITKTHTGEKFRLNDQVTFTITVKNIYAEPQTITISEINGVTFDGPNVFENVEPGAEVSVNALYTITQEDVDNGSFTNTATALFSNGQSYTDTDTVITEPTPVASISIEKTAEQKEGGYAAGDTVTYTIRVVNDGEQQLTDIQVSDPLTGLNETIQSLAPGEEKIFTTTYTVTEQDVLAGKIVNVATVKATDEDGKTVEDETTKELETEEKNSHLTVIKTTTSTPADGKAYSVGEKITYKITVTNDGNITVTNVQVTDELTGNVGDLAWTVDSIAPGESKEFTAEYTVTEADAKAGKVHNVATAQGSTDDPENPEVPVTPGETEDPVNPMPTETPKPTITPTPGATQTPVVTPSTPSNNGTTTKTAVKTGDTTPVGAFVGLFAAAAIVAGAAVYFKRRKRDK